MPKFFVALCALVVAGLSCGAALAETIQIVAFGGSNTYGPRLARSDAYPAQLERMLKADGYDVVIRNEGTNGQTTADELRGLDRAVPRGTHIVLFQPGDNDRRKGVTNTEENLQAIVQRLLDREILVLFFGPPQRYRYVKHFPIVRMPEIIKLAPDDLQADQQHLTANGYRVAAEKMLPRVKKLIQKLSKSGAQRVIPAGKPSAAR